MRIDNWGVGRKMQLPDECFGRRFLVSCSVEGADAQPAWDISELAFPEETVIWELQVYSCSAGADVASLRLALGDQLPTTAAMMTALEPLMPGLGLHGPDPRDIRPACDGEMGWNKLRMPIAAGGRRLVLEVTGAVGKSPVVTVGVVVSSVPKEVPEWLSSAKDS